MELDTQHAIYEGKQEYGIPQKVRLGEDSYFISIITKDFPQEFETIDSKIIRIETDSCVEFLSVFLLPFVGITFFLVYPSWTRILGMWFVLFLSILIPTVWHKISCKNSEGIGKIYYPSIRVTDEKGTPITTMTPRAYVMEKEMRESQYRSPILPFIIYKSVRNFIFDKHKFEKALQSALTSHKIKMDMKPE